MNRSTLAQHTEVLQIYNNLSTWLEEHGTYNQDEPRKFAGRHLGKLVIDGMEPAFDFHLSAVALGTHLPLLRDSFDLADTSGLSFYHTPEHYAINPHYKHGDPDHILPYVRFLIHEKRPQSELKDSELSLIHNPDSNTLYVQHRHNFRGVEQHLLLHDFQSEKLLQGEPGSVTQAELKGLQQLNHILHTADIDTLTDEAPWQDKLLRKLNGEF